ncbi:NIPA-like protein, partial [Nibea albiflora]
MATLGSSRGDRLGNSNHQKSSLASPEKVRELLNDGVSSTDTGSNRYGWINVGCDMLKCSSCQAFLCASLQPTLDFEKYESRIAEISRQLQTQHEKFCPWPDFPCPERFWLVPACEPSALLTSFLERFQSACLLAQQLPAMKPEQLKSMSLTEDVVSVILQLIEEEQKRKGGTPCSEPLAVQVAACIVSLCGWAASRDSPSPSEELPSPLTRGKRTASRGRGQGDNSGPDGTSSLQHPPKRLCLSSLGGPDGMLHKNAFDPLAQHRDWCPWISVGKENVDPGVIPSLDVGTALHQQGWKAALDLLVPMKKNSNTAGGSPAQASKV